MEFTRKNYLELFRDGVPVIAGGRTSNRHTSLVEAGEHAFEHAKEIASPGEYEVRIDGGLYYMVRIIDLVLDADIDDPGPPPEAQAEFSLDSTAYAGTENTDITFGIERGIRTDQTLTVDWAITNASVLPVSGTVTFLPGDDIKNITVAAQEVDTTELGDIALANPQYVSGTFSNPILGSPFTALFSIFNLSSGGSLIDQCNNTGKSTASPPEITGTSHFINDGASMASVRALNTSPGDGVLFEAGSTFTVTGNSDRLLLQNGVKYGRFGSGANPIITANGVVLGNRFNGLIEGLNGQNNIIVDGIDVTHPGGNNFMIWLKDTNGATVRNLTVHNVPATDPLSNGGIILTGVNNVNIINCYLHDLRGNPHETISITGGSTNVLVDSVKVERCGHAAINTKGACDGVEVRFSEFTATTDDPMVYVDRSRNVRYHHNYIHHSSTNPSTTFKPLMAIGLEGLGGNADRFNRNIEFDHNVIFAAERVALKISIKWSAFDASTGGSKLPFPVMDNIHFHHNTIYRNISNIAAVSFVDNRDDPRTTGGGQDASDWLDFVFEDNIIFDMGNAISLGVDNVIFSGNTFRNNLFETGAVANPNFGTNPVITNDVLLADVDNGLFTLLPGSPAIGADHLGNNIGSDLTSICPLTS